MAAVGANSLNRNGVCRAKWYDQSRGKLALLEEMGVEDLPITGNSVAGRRSVPASPSSILMLEFTAEECARFTAVALAVTFPNRNALQVCGRPPVTAEMNGLTGPAGAAPSTGLPASYHPGPRPLLGNLSLVAERQGDYGRAVALLEESLALYRELGDTQGIATWLTHLGGRRSGKATMGGR